MKIEEIILNLNLTSTEPCRNNISVKTIEECNVFSFGGMKRKLHCRKKAASRNEKSQKSQSSLL